MREQLLSTSEAADFLNINPWTLRRYLRNGLIKAHKLVDRTGNKAHWRIHEQDLIDFINQGSNIQEA